MAYVGLMNATTVSEAKTHFSALIRRVILGETLLIMHRGRPVARLSPVSAVDDAADEERLTALERSGLIRRALEPRDSSILDLEEDAALVLTAATGLVQAILDERDEGS